MRHFEDYELEHLLLNSRGTFLGQFLCKWHLKKCTLCRKRLEALREDQLFIRQIRNGLKRMQQEMALGRGKNE